MPPSGSQSRAELTWQPELGLRAVTKLAHWNAQNCIVMAPSPLLQGGEHLDRLICKRLGFIGVAALAQLATDSCRMTLHQRCSLGVSISNL